MTARDFCYWLQGFFELDDSGVTKAERITAKQMDTIKRHLNLVFAHDIDPSMGDKTHQDKLNKIHGDEDKIVRC